MGSSRLPGKVLLAVKGKPLLQYMVERVQRSSFVQEVVIAMPKGKDNEPIAKLAEGVNIPYFCGSEDNVLERVVGAAQSRNADVIVQLTGDCPLIDPELVDECIEKYNEDRWDYVANELTRTYPIGFDVAVMSTDLLASTLHEPDLSESDREHVTTYIVDRPNKYRLCNVSGPIHMHHPELAVTMDTAEDFLLIRSIIETLGVTSAHFTAEEVIDYLLTHPKIACLNEFVARKSKK